MSQAHYKGIPTVELAEGYIVSRIASGGWQLAGGHGSVSRGEAIKAMIESVDAGINVFDCADIYAGVEELIGEFLATYRGARGTQAAAELHVHTKFVPDLDVLSTLDKTYVEKIIDRSLRRLRLDQLDLVQFHWWDYSVPRYVEVAGYLNELRKAGKIRHLAVTNFDVSHLREIVDAGISICANQVQFSALDHRPEHGMTEYCRQADIKLLCYGTLAGGLLTEQSFRQPAPPGATNRSLIKYKLIVDQFGSWELFQELLTALYRVAQRHNATIANIATKLILEKPMVATAIIGTKTSDHLQENRHIFDIELTDRDKTEIATVRAKSTWNAGDIYDLERIIDGPHGRIMKYNLNHQDY